MISSPGATLVSLRPRVRSGPTYEFTSGPEAAEIYESTGRLLDQWQKDALNDHCAETPTGTWITLESLEELSRQNGKGEIINAIILLHLFVLGTRTVVYSAHEFATAKESYLKLYELIVNTPELHAKVAFYHNSNEDTSIGLKTGQRVKFRTRSKDGGRGFTGDAIIFDEAFNISRASLSALLPTLSARPNPHIYYFSSAAKATEESDVLRVLDKRGDEGDLKLMCRRWGADPESDTDDVRALEQSNPALDVRISRDYVAVERSGMTEAEYRRERLGIPDKPGAIIAAFGRGIWPAGKSLVDADLSSPVVSIDMRTGALRSLAIAVASVRDDGCDDVDIARYEKGAGEQWTRDYALEAVQQILERHGLDSVVIDQYGEGNGLLIPMFEEAGITVVKLNTSDMRSGAVGLVDGFANGRIKHHDDDQLNSAANGAVKKKSGEGFLWDQTKSPVDLTTLRAVTAAWWYLQLTRSADYDVLDSIG